MTSPTPRRALGHARVSTGEQAESGYSLPEQCDRIRVYCAQHDLLLIDIISDDFTGRTLNRPGLERITELANAGAFDVLVCIKLDRLARVNHLRRLYEEHLAAHAIDVRYVEQTFEATAAGRLQKVIMGEFAEHESDLIRERTLGGRIRKARDRGVMPVNFKAFGYRLITRAQADVLPEFRGRDGELVLVPENAEIAVQVFEQYAAGQSL